MKTSEIKEDDFLVIASEDGEVLKVRADGLDGGEDCPLIYCDIPLDYCRPEMKCSVTFASPEEILAVWRGGKWVRVTEIDGLAGMAPTEAS